MARRKLLVADLLCGAGGSSTGCIRALLELGYSLNDIVLTCVNHWPVAIDTHRRNHPTARHHVQDIATVRPHLIVPEGYLDLLMASPTCTHHSVARGGKPTSDQQRSDPWHIITWLTELRVKRLIIENVWEFLRWGPVDWRTGKPVKGREGEYFRAWIDTIRRLGFDPEWRKLNAADYGDATTRSRFILMARSDGRRLLWPVATHHKRGGDQVALFPSLKPWRAAREIIDWSVKGRSIFNRPKPLAPKTLARIIAGALKFGWPAPFLFRLLRELDRSLAVHIRLAFAERHAERAAKERGKRRLRIRRMVAWLRRLRAEPGDYAGTGRAPDPMLVTLRRNGDGRSIAGPIPTVAANGTHIGLAEPIVLSQHGTGAPRSAVDPLPTITTGGSGSDGHVGCARPMLVEPFVVTAAHGVDADDTNPHNRRVKSVHDPLGAMHAGGGKFGVVEPFVLSQASGGAPRSGSEPLPTIVAGGHGGSGTALISPYYGSGSGETCCSADDPLPTVTSKARFGMVVPVTQSGGGASARDVADPVPTMTTAKGGEFAIVMPITHHDHSDRVRSGSEPLPTVTGANRGELAFITAQHGERPGQAPRVHDIGQPAPTIAASGHVDLVEPTEEYDILFRMLEAHELGAAMGFTDEDQEYEFAGTKTEQIKQIGNAVSVAKMRACVRAIMADVARPGVAVAAAEEMVA
jgi:DNA (cytosine-5)-methyltransferase 1